MKRLYFFSLITIPFVFFISCGGIPVYTFGGKATIHVLNEKGEPFKKEDGTRFEVRNIGDSGYYVNTEKDELTYIISVSVPRKTKVAFDNKNARKREEEILLQKLKTTKGVVIIDKNGEYKPKIQYLVNASIINKTPNNFGSNYEFEDYVVLEKK